MAESNVNIPSPSRPLNGAVRVPRAAGERSQQEMKTSVHQELIKRLDLEKLATIPNDRGAQLQLSALIQQLIAELGIPLSSAERDQLAQDVLDEVFGLGPLEPLLQDPTISDILVNTCSTVYVERRGVCTDGGFLQRQSPPFTGD